MPAETREPQRPGESDKDFDKREAAHWQKVSENERALRQAREFVAKRLGKKL